MAIHRERSLQATAGVIAVSIVVGFVLAQRCGHDRYRVARFDLVVPGPMQSRAGVAIQIERGEDEIVPPSGLEVRLLDRDKRSFLIEPASTMNLLVPHPGYTFFAPLGYVDPIVSPILEFKDVQGRAQRLELPNFPPPQRVQLHPKPHPLFEVVRDVAGRSVTLRPKIALAPGEKWTATVLRTESDPGPNLFHYGLGSTASEDRVVPGPQEVRLSEPYVERSKAVEIRIQPYRIQEHVDTVDVSGLFLDSRFGQTCACVPERRSYALSAGASLVLPAQSERPLTRSRTGDRRDVSFQLDLKPNTWSRVVSMRILSTSPSTGLRFLRIGAGLLVGPSNPSGPVRQKEFKAKLRIKTIEERPLPEIEATVPINPS